MAGMKLKKRLNTVYVIISSNICIFVSKSQQSSEVQLEIPCNGIYTRHKTYLPVHHSERATNSVELRLGGARAQCLVFYPADNLYDHAFDLIKRHSS